MQTFVVERTTVRVCSQKYEELTPGRLPVTRLFTAVDLRFDAVEVR